jgi:hypothetical protein
MPADPLTASLVGAGAAANLIGGIAGGKGGEDRPAYNVPPVAIEAAQTGLDAARTGLEAIGGAPSPEQFQGVSQDVLARLQELTAAQPTIDAEQLTDQIIQTQREATAPERAARESAFREAAGAFGPSSELSSQRAAEVAQERSNVAAQVAAILPQLKEAQFQQYSQRLAQQLGLQQSIQQSALLPFQAVTGAYQGYTGQLLGAGQAAFQPIPTQRYESPVAAGVSRVGSELTQIPETLYYLQNLQSGKKKTT